MVEYGGGGGGGSGSSGSSGFIKASLSLCRPPRRSILREKVVRSCNGEECRETTTMTGERTHVAFKENHHRRCRRRRRRDLFRFDVIF
ncbi:hypothetical protein M0802_016993 [Mischocyttarus mexicanus]|nr:hypothetical protein M0802_016993 [Mischocyttarus mexicanus]